MSLLKKLRAIGTSKKAMEWFRSYLNGRNQSVRIGCETSEPRLLSYGVPQGSILGSALFNIYINDLPSMPKVGSLECYIDDSQLYLSFPFPRYHLSRRSADRRSSEHCFMVLQEQSTHEPGQDKTSGSGDSADADEDTR